MSDTTAAVNDSPLVDLDIHTMFGIKVSGKRHDEPILEPGLVVKIVDQTGGRVDYFGNRIA
ncbi:MAG: hypothetical protein Rhob2KO_53940 [Rhodopirellula baltica]